VLTELNGHSAGRLVALSGLAAGADTMFAEEAVARGVALEAYLAAEDLLENFAPGPERERFERLVARAVRVHRLPFATRSNGAYMALGYALVEGCHLLLAAWNGLPAAALGGTGDVVAYARECGRPVLHIHPVQRTTALLQ
jgi:hypothetical protein